MTMKELLEKARRLGIQPWQLEMMQAVPNDQVRDLVADFRRGVAQPSSLTENKSEARPPSIAVEVPLAPPPGVKIIDQMCDVADALDRRELEKKLRR